MQIFGSGAATQEVYAAAAKFPRTGPGEEKPITAFLDKAVHFIQQFRQPLNFIDHDNPIFGGKLLRHATWVLSESQVNRMVQEVIDARIPQRVADKKGLAGLPRPEQKMRFFRQKRRQIEHSLDRRVAVVCLLVWHLCRQI
jgi:hypothetical protein